MSDKFVAFYSRADENYVSGMIKTLAIGIRKLQPVLSQS